MSDDNLTDGGPLIIEDVDCVMSAQTFQCPVRYPGLLKRLKMLLCVHDLTEPYYDSLWMFGGAIRAGERFCKKCGKVKK